MPYIQSFQVHFHIHKVNTSLRRTPSTECDLVWDQKPRVRYILNVNCIVLFLFDLVESQERNQQSQKSISMVILFFSFVHIHKVFVGMHVCCWITVALLGKKVEEVSTTSLNLINSVVYLSLESLNDDSRQEKLVSQSMFEPFLGCLELSVLKNHWSSVTTRHRRDQYFSISVIMPTSNWKCLLYFFVFHWHN